MEATVRGVVKLVYLRVPQVHVPVYTCVHAVLCFKKIHF